VENSQNNSYLDDDDDDDDDDGPIAVTNAISTRNPRTIISNKPRDAAIS